MPLPFEFEKGVVLGLEGVLISSCSSSGKYSSTKKSASVVSSEPASVLDTRRSPSPPTSTSTLSSSLGGGGGGGGSGGGGGCSSETVGVAAVSGNPSTKWPPSSSTSQQENISSSAAVVESSHGGSGMKKDDWGFELQPIPNSIDIVGGGGSGGGGGGGDVAVAGIGKCGMGMEDWESVLSEPAAASPGQEQSILKLIMVDAEDPSIGLSRLLQSGGVGMDFDFNGGFVDPQGGFGFEGGNLMGNFNTSSSSVSIPCSGFPTSSNNNNNSTTININNGRIGSLSNPTSIPNFKATTNPATPIFGSPPTTNNVLPISLSPGMFHQQQHHPQFLPQPHQFESPEEKPQIVNPQNQLLLNQQQAHHLQNPSFMLPLSFPQQEHQLLLPPQPKRHNPGIVDPASQILKTPFLDSGQEAFLRRPPQSGFPHQLQWFAHYGQQRPTMGMKPKMGSEEMAQQQQQQQQNQAIYDQLYKAAELVETGNSVHAQSILARLNHQLSQIGKPFHRAAYFFKEALQLLLNSNGSNITPSATSSHPINLIFKIGAYKSFSEISPVLQFANFTCNQALLEALDGFDRIHIIDFDIGFGGQWASLMQELSMRSGGAPSLKITAFASPSAHDQIELCLTRENLNYFASEINIPFELEIVSIDSLNSASLSFPLHVLDSEAIAVNLPVGASSNYLIPLPMVLRFVKQLSPKIVVSVDRGCDRTDLPFAQHFVNALQSNSYLLESLDAVNVNLDALQKIEKYLLQPTIQKLVLGRYNSPEKTPSWRTLFLSTGFSPLTFSNFTESQAECVVKKIPVRGFHIEKKQSSLVLCWQRKELISASAWRC
ncbi:Transcription factor GRAS [Dillenia turbinata]|uniref:Transcription factor GRAS n=1 Tax=Dillenia turbinata TaxID=194707 RepID=A0AAN8Z2R5_9MAGN